MIAGHGILLLVRSLVLLVDDDQSETLERQKYGTAGTEDDIVGILRELFLPNLHAFCIGVFRVVDAEAVAEDVLQTFHDLNGKGNLRQEG